MSYSPPPPPYWQGYGYGYGPGHGPEPPVPPPPDRGNLGMILLLVLGLPLLLLSGAGSVYFVLTADEASVAARRAAAAEADQGPPDVLFDPGATPSQQPSPSAEPSRPDQPGQPDQSGQTGQGQTGQGQTGQGQTGQGQAGQAVARLGQAVTLTGTDPGLRIAATAERLVSPATPANDLLKPAAGMRFVAVQLSLANQGQSPYNDAPAAGALLIDAEGRQYQANPGAQVREAQPFGGGGTVTIDAGGSGKGAVVFEIPETATPATFRFALNAGLAGLAGQKGEWQLT
ncbi:DUF4352 domain-containing protein [Nonomuraea sp. NPDC050783]|uniref:DUF4352 domain-containing protein n=1 Tax=Nonomuraea sp. NPDC050783 TaxID=3154634 RepID=UPI00346654A2